VNEAERPCVEQQVCGDQPLAGVGNDVRRQAGEHRDCADFGVRFQYRDGLGHLDGVFPQPSEADEYRVRHSPRRPLSEVLGVLLRRFRLLLPEAPQQLDQKQGISGSGAAAGLGEALGGRAAPAGRDQPLRRPS
jgi:hypothetical protein